MNLKVAGPRVEDIFSLMIPWAQSSSQSESRGLGIGRTLSVCMSASDEHTSDARMCRVNLWGIYNPALLRSCTRSVYNMHPHPWNPEATEPIAQQGEGSPLLIEINCRSQTVSLKGDRDSGPRNISTTSLEELPVMLAPWRGRSSYTLFLRAGSPMASEGSFPVDSGLLPLVPLPVSIHTQWSLLADSLS